MSKQSCREVVIFLQDQALRDLLSVIPLTHFGQDDKALFAVLDKSVKGLMREGVELDSLSYPSQLHRQGRIAYFALEEDLDQFGKEGSHLRNCLLPACAADAELIDYPFRMISEGLFVCEFLEDCEMLRLKSLAQYIHYWTLQCFQRSYGLNSLESRLEMSIYYLLRDLEGLQIEITDSLQSEFFRSKQIEESIQAVIFVELRNFGRKFVHHRELRGCVIESCNHMPQIILQ